MKKVLTTALIGCAFAISTVSGAAETNMDPGLRSKAKRAADSGLRFLRDRYAEDGSWSKSVGITGLVVRAFLENRRGYDESDGPFITKPVNFLLNNVRPDGSISETPHNRNYNTAVAINALVATKNPAYVKVIDNAVKFLKGLQIDDADDYSKDHRYYGGIGYGGDERPDLSNTYMAVEALKAADTDKTDPVWDKALIFINRTQNRSESNDQSWAANDGGFTYMPGYSPNGGTSSYGGMTSAGLLSLLFAGVDKQDPRVQAAHDWIVQNYTLEENPGAKVKSQGLYYYYNAFAKAMKAYNDVDIKDAAGVSHNWRNDLASKLISLQRKDGSWLNDGSSRWWESNPDLVTAWSVIALNHIINP